MEAAFAARNAAGQTPAGTPDRDFGSSSASGIKLDWKAQKEEQARIRKRQNELKKTEDSIHALETRDSEIDGLLSHEEVYTDVDTLMELNREKEDGSDGWTIGPERMVESIGWNGWLRRLIGMDKETVNG